LAKMELTCFSTADSESTRAAAMPGLARPRAISRRTSSSRGVSQRRAEPAMRVRLDTSASTTTGSMEELGPGGQPDADRKPGDPGLDCGEDALVR